jgi:hypothetical protein
MLIQRTILAIAAMALGAAAVLALPGFSPEVAASAAPVAQTAIPAVEVQTVDKGCSQQHWPYFGQECLRNQTGKVHTVRLIAVDKVK